jgi:hypothetical protein
MIAHIFLAAFSSFISFVGELTAVLCPLLCPVSSEEEEDKL